MISSAVVIPEQQSPPRSPSPSLKRRLSSFTSETNKRPKLDTQNSSSNRNQNGLPSPQSAMSPPRRKPALATGAAEERKRGQRLFGALLGTLSQTGSKTAHRKRDEIEQRQRDRAKKESSEREDERQRKRAELDNERRAEQIAWDAESTRIRHRNLRAMAHFLQTKSEPKLYYKPWDLRSEEKEHIERQIEEVEKIIQKELGEGNVEDARSPDPVERRSSPQAGSTQMAKTEHEDTDMTGTTGSNVKELPENQRGITSTTTSASNGSTTDRRSTGQEEKSRDDDHGGGELVEGQEDDVIY